MKTAAWEGLDAEGWRQRLAVPAVSVYLTVGSTNDAARERAEAGAASLTLVISDHQTKGRGRAGRAWLSQPGSSLLCSMVLRAPESAESAVGAAPVRIGHAVAQAIEQVSALEARVKWPNDVVIPGRGKVAGILCEAAVRQQATAYVVAGIGVNVRDPGRDYVSLESSAGRALSRSELLVAIIDALRPLANNITAPLTAAELAALRSRDILFEQEVEDDSGLRGLARGIDATGSLLVETADGIRAIHNATIRLAGTHRYPGACA
jgi:BirA family biotin operon repressor/biotin-[acetyl-CoA-carboxylase] ligase